MHPGAAHLLERDLLPDDHLGHARAAQVHRGVALDHDDDVAEARDVGAAGRRRPEQAADLRHPARQRHLVVEDAPRAAAAREQVSTWSVIRAPARVDEPEDRQLLAQRRLGGADDLLDGARAPRARPSPSGRWRRRSPGRPSTVPRPVTTPSAGRPGRQRVRVAAVLDEAALVEEQGDRGRGRSSLPCASSLASALGGRVAGGRVRRVQPRPHVADPGVAALLGRGHAREGLTGLHHSLLRALPASLARSTVRCTRRTVVRSARVRHGSPSPRAMSIRCTSEVPSPISRILASR